MYNNYHLSRSNLQTKANSTFCRQSLLTDEQVANAPVLILGNKIDIPGAASEDEIRSQFGLHGQTTGRVSATRELSSSKILLLLIFTFGLFMTQLWGIFKNLMF